MTEGLQSVHPSGLSSGGTSQPGDSTRAGASSREADGATRGTGFHATGGSTPAGFAGGAPLALAGILGVTEETPLPRWPEARAELPALRAQLRRAERKRDVDRERLIAAALARALVRRRCELDIAVRLARRAVLLGEDALRTDTHHEDQRATGGRIHRTPAGRG